MNDRLFAFLFWGGLAFVLLNTWAWQGEKDRARSTPPTVPYVSPRQIQSLPRLGEKLTDESGTEYSCRPNGSVLICE